MNPIFICNKPTITTSDKFLFPTLSMIPSFNVDMSVSDLSNSHLPQMCISVEKNRTKSKKRGLMQMTNGERVVLHANGVESGGIQSPVKKRRKKNNQCNRLLFTDFCLRSQHANSLLFLCF